MSKLPTGEFIPTDCPFCGNALEPSHNHEEPLMLVRNVGFIHWRCWRKLKTTIEPKEEGSTVNYENQLLFDD